MSIYYPKSTVFIKSRAKLLRRHFPELTLIGSLNATAMALGFKDWFDATKRIGSPGIVLGIPDEKILREIKLQRRYQQTRALIDYTNLPPTDLEEFVRHWNLTSDYPSTLSEFAGIYSCVLHDLQTDAPFDPDNSRIDISEWEAPKMVLDGIIRAYGGGKYFYYYLSNYRFASMPCFLRGNYPSYQEHEDAHYVKIAFAHEFPESEVMESLHYASVNEPLIFEWLTGEVPASEPGAMKERVTISKLLAEAKQFPDDWFALSFRSDFSIIDKPVHYYPAIIGSDFVKFIESKGNLAGLNLKWFKVKQMPLDNSSLRIDLSKVEESFAIYSSPFKKRPMGNFEYNFISETGALMLHEELDESWVDELQDGLTVVESVDGSFVSKTHIKSPAM